MLFFVRKQLKETRDMVVLETLLVSILFIASILTLFMNPTKKLLLPWLTSKKPPSSKPSKNTVKCEEEIKQVFRTFDKNKDGFITKEELGQSLKQMGIDDDDELGQMLEKLDSNGDGLIDLKEFSGIFDVADCLDELKEAFDVFDGDRDGLISVAELGVVLGNLGMKEGEREDCCREMIRKVDVDGDGMVSFLEFKNMMSSSQFHGVKSH